MFENLFFGDPDSELYTDSAAEYYEQYPEDLLGLREFMDLIIRGYMTQLEEGYSILTVKPDFVAIKPDYDSDVRSSYRVEALPVSVGAAKKKREPATSKWQCPQDGRLIRDRLRLAVQHQTKDKRKTAPTIKRFEELRIARLRDCALKTGAQEKER